MRAGKVVVFVVSGTGNVSTRLTTADGGLIPANSANEDTRTVSTSGGERSSLVDSVYDVPMYVLVNGNTASAAEVFAAALQVSAFYTVKARHSTHALVERVTHSMRAPYAQENGRAKLAGARTFGKGIVQSLQELRSGGVAVTYARYETPLHHNIHQVGAC